MLRYLTTFLIMVIRWPTPVPFTSKDRVTYQINGKITMSKEKKMNMKDFWVGRKLLITCSISKQNILAIFKTNTYTFKKTSFKLENIFKRSTLCIHSYERESLQSFPKWWNLFKILSKTTQSTFSNKSKWSRKQLRAHR